MNPVSACARRPVMESKVRRLSITLDSARRARTALSLLLCLGVGGCTVGPDFTRPDSPVADTSVFATAEPSARSTAEEATLQAWWTVFNDATLTSLVQEAFRSNLDLQVATTRIRQARAGRGLARSGLGPTVSASTSFRRSQASGDSGTSNRAVNQYLAGFDAGWEIDIFGGVLRGVEAAGAQVQAAVENRRDALVTLAAEIARNYVDLRTYQQRLVIARKNLETQRHSAEVTRQRFAGGFASGLDVAAADAQVATTQAGIPLLESAARQTIHGLSVLVGREPRALVSDLSRATPMPPVPPRVPIGVPSDLLRRRPDIRLAEADIHAATANIGVAAADLYPRLSLGWSIGWNSGNSGGVLGALTRFWSLGPSVTWDLFQSGRTLSNIELQKALKEESVLAYRQTVLTAFQEVEDALVASAREQEHRESLEAAVVANRKATELATKLYAEGEKDFLNVLIAQRALYASEDALAQSSQAMAVDLIALYKALGGGWRVANQLPCPSRAVAETGALQADCPT